MLWWREKVLGSNHKTSHSSNYEKSKKWMPIFSYWKAQRRHMGTNCDEWFAQPYIISASNSPPNQSRAQYKYPTAHCRILSFSFCKKKPRLAYAWALEKISIMNWEEDILVLKLLSLVGIFSLRLFFLRVVACSLTLSFGGSMSLNGSKFSAPLLLLSLIKVELKWIQGIALNTVENEAHSPCLIEFRPKKLGFCCFNLKATSCSM